jgi:hypothetical protein
MAFPPPGNQSVKLMANASPFPGAFATVHCLGPVSPAPPSPNYPVPVLYDEIRRKWVGAEIYTQIQLAHYGLVFTTAVTTSPQNPGNTESQNTPSPALLPFLYLPHFGSALQAGLSLEIEWYAHVFGDLVAQTRNFVIKATRAQDGVSVTPGDVVMTFPTPAWNGSFNSFLKQDWVQATITAVGLVVTEYENVVLYPQISFNDPGSNGNMAIDNFQLRARYVSLA